MRKEYSFFTGFRVSLVMRLGCSERGGGIGSHDKPRANSILFFACGRSDSQSVCLKYCQHQSQKMYEKVVGVGYREKLYPHTVQMCPTAIY